MKKVLLLYRDESQAFPHRLREVLLARGVEVVEARCDQIARLKGTFDRTVLYLAEQHRPKEAIEPHWLDDLGGTWSALAALVKASFSSGHLLVFNETAGFSDEVDSYWSAVLACCVKENSDFSATLITWEANAVKQLPQHLDWLLTTREPECLLSHDGVKVPRLTAITPPTAGNLQLASDRSYLVSGGLGGVGTGLIKWLLQCGARRIINLNRCPPNPEQTELWQRLGSEYEARLDTLTVDLSDGQEMQKILAGALAEAPPLAGVFHCAGTLDQALFKQQPWAQVNEMLQAKFVGAWNLHLATLHQPLTHFVVFSSLAALLGQAGQSGYALANALAEDLIVHRRALGLPGLAVQWGPWSSGGMASRAGDSLAATYRHLGLSMYDAEVYLQTLARLMSISVENNAENNAENNTLPARVGVFGLDWERYLSATPAAPLCAELAPAVDESDKNEAISLVSRLAKVAPKRRLRLLRERLKQLVVDCLDRAETQSIAETDGFAELGIDSLHSMILHRKLEKELCSSLSPTIAFDHPSIAALAAFFANGLLKHLFSPPSPPQSGGTDDEQMRRFSEEELASILTMEIECVETRS